MPPVTSLQIIIGWIREIFLILFVILIYIPGLLFRLKKTDGGHRKQIVIASDFGGTGLLYYFLRKRFMEAGFPVFLFSGHRVWKDIRSTAKDLANELEEWNIQDGILIGHGMGSLVAIALPDSARRRISHLISLGSPFHGTRLLLKLGFIPAFRDMSVGSEFLLLNRMNALLFPSFTPFIAWKDQWIVPGTLANFGQGRDLIFDRLGHYMLVFDKGNIETLLEFVDSEYSEPKTAVEMVQKNLSAGAKVKTSAKKKATHKKTAKKKTKR